MAARVGPNKKNRILFFLSKQSRRVRYIRMSSEQMNLMDLPTEVLDKIFYECDRSSVLTLEKVNKRCNQVTTNTYFATKYWLKFNVELSFCSRGDDCIGGNNTDVNPEMIFDSPSNSSIEDIQDYEDATGMVMCEHYACRCCLYGIVDAYGIDMEPSEVHDHMINSDDTKCAACGCDWSEYLYRKFYDEGSFYINRRAKAREALEAKNELEAQWALETEWALEAQWALESDDQQQTTLSFELLF